MKPTSQTATRSVFIFYYCLLPQQSNQCQVLKTGLSRLLDVQNIPFLVTNFTCETNQIKKFLSFSTHDIISLQASTVTSILILKTSVPLKENICNVLKIIHNVL